MLAQRLQESTGPSDCVARLGGDEFAIIREFVTPHELIEFLDSLYLAIRQPMICGGHQLVPDASIGVAQAPDHGAGSDELIRNADLAMYSAKSAGGRSYRFFERQMEAKAKAHHQMASDLREAIAQNALEIHYQPVHDLSSGSITACEALVRWQHPFNGAISPSSFIPVAEASGLITRLGEWVLEEACREAASWPSHIKVAVNVSPAQFRSKTFGLRVAKALANSNLLPSRLELEITEAVVMQDDESASTILHQLRNIRCTHSAR